MQFMITLDRDEDGVWISECPSIPGCVSQGATKAEAIKNIKEAIQACLEVRSERDLSLTIGTQ
jgi:predicted RNase H-like HicB family nuclease